MGIRAGKAAWTVMALAGGIAVTAAVAAVAMSWTPERREGRADASPDAAAPVAAAPVEAAPPAAPPVEAPRVVRAVASAVVDGEVHHADVYFDFKSTRLRADAVRLLQEKAALVATGGSWGVLVQGHADRQGPAEYNRALAQRRAEAVRTFLVELGVPEASIRVVTIGQDGALCDDDGSQCQQLNRRVHLEIRRLGHAELPVRPAIATGDVLDGGTGGVAPAGRRAER